MRKLKINIYTRGLTFYNLLIYYNVDPKLYDFKTLQPFYNEEDKLIFYHLKPRKKYLDTVDILIVE